MREPCYPAARAWRRTVVAPLALLASLGAYAAPLDTDGDGIPDALEAADGLSWEVKDNDIFSNAWLFVKQQYRDFLNREADAAGRDYWAIEISSGRLPRENAIYNFLTSAEFGGNVSPIVRLYFSFFKRPPDIDGLRYYVDLLKQGASLPAIAEGFVASPEFQATYGNRTNAEFVQLVYRNVLDRQPDPSGYTFYLGELDSGRRTRGEVMVAFSESPENQQKMAPKVSVTMMYAGMLQRTPDAGGFAYWVSQLAAGVTGMQLIRNFLDSVEYRDRFMAFYSLAPTSKSVDAARFLTQATFGPRSLTEIAYVQTIGYDAWLNNQMGLPAASHQQYLRDALARSTTGSVYEDQSYEAIWQQWLTGEEQLRARMSFALSEIFVISNIAPNLNPWAMSSYMDILNRNAFGNYRALLEEVTLSPAMGYFLNMLGNDKEDPAKGRLPNENYAREVLQLFSIGLVQLNPDATPVIGTDGKGVPTYGEDEVKGFAKVFTGWGFAGNNTASNSAWFSQKSNWTDPMVAWPGRHSAASKTLLNGTVLPANQTPEQDLRDALDNIFYHPNVGPFICRQLIQRFVTSNPGRGAVQRCAAVFANNGFGERGNLGSVIRTILLDPESRTVGGNPANFGKQREPVIRFANMLRAFNAKSTSGRNAIHDLDSPDDGLAQSPLIAPSVFNFFSPFYRAPGAIAQAGLVSPEFQITTETSVTGALNFFGSLVDRGAYGWNDTQLTMDYSRLQAIAYDAGKLADHINMLLMAGSMSPETRATIVRAVSAIAATRPRDRVEAALQLTSFAPDFVIQK